MSRKKKMQTPSDERISLIEYGEIEIFMCFFLISVFMKVPEKSVENNIDVSLFLFLTLTLIFTVALPLPPFYLSLALCVYIYIYIMNRIFANDTGDQGSIPGRVMPKNLK